MNFSKPSLAWFYIIVFHLSLVLYFATVPDEVLLFSIGFAILYTLVFFFSIGLIVKTSNITSITQIIDAVHNLVLSTFKLLIPVGGFYIFGTLTKIFLSSIGDILILISLLLVGFILVFSVSSLSVLTIALVYFRIASK